MCKIIILVSILMAIVACSNGSSRAPVVNQVPIVVDSGFNGNASIINGYPNTPFVTVTICVPGTSQCQSIDHIILDTGSDALRINASVLNPKFSFPSVMKNNQPVFSCEEFGSGYVFGSTNKVDVLMGGETAKNINFQIVDDSESQSGVPSSCSAAGGFASFAAVGAKGIVGVRNIAVVGANFYYTCNNESCSIIARADVPSSFAYASPVYNFGQDNNGVILQFPEAPANGATSFTGTLTFGLGTQTNNQIESNSHIFYSTESIAGLILVEYNGKILTSAFDSGTSLITFSDTAINQCTSKPFTGYYCPNPAPYYIDAILASYDGQNVTELVYPLINPMNYENNAITGNVLLPHTGSICVGCETFADSIFLWGLPFFFGKTVYIGFNGRSTPVGSGPFMGYSK